MNVPVVVIVVVMTDVTVMQGVGVMMPVQQFMCIRVGAVAQAEVDSADGEVIVGIVDRIAVRVYRCPDELIAVADREDVL